jgi:acyl-coenzyme A thioesterase PaaI-like protein
VQAPKGPQNPALFHKLKAQIEQGYMPTPLGDTLGMRFVSLEIGKVVVDLPVSAKVLNSMNYLHGGSMAALADTTMGFAAFTVLEEGEATTTMEFGPCSTE